MRTIILAFTTLFSCNSGYDKEQFNLSLNPSFEFSIQYNEGNDLLDPQDSNAFNHSNIKLYYKENREFNEVYNINLDYPRNIKIYKNYSKYRIGG
ncbi:MAG: hypothetical protein ACK5H1_01820 [Tenacibaculum sp.]